MKNYTVLFCVLVAAFFVMLAIPSPALACACCAEPGTYSISTKKPGSYEIDELKKIGFLTSDLYMTEAGEDGIKGINPIGISYKPSVLLQNKIWKFTLTDNDGKSGTLTLPIAASMVAFMADIHDGKQGGAGGPLLYKEWRFKAKVSSGTGIFQKGIAPATDYFLVFLGRGNMCTSADQFTHWRLEITGKKASYAFFGDLKPLEN